MCWMWKLKFNLKAYQIYCCLAWPNYQNGPNRRIHIPKCGLLTNCIYNWVTDPFSTSKWLSEPQFCEKKYVDGIKVARNGQKTAILASVWWICSSLILAHMFNLLGNAADSQSLDCSAKQNKKLATLEQNLFCICYLINIKRYLYYYKWSLVYVTFLAWFFIRIVATVIGSITS